MKKLFTFLLLMAGMTAYGQGLNMLYNFSNNPQWFDSYCSSAVADSTYFLVMGNTSQEADSFDHCFVAAFDYSGHLKWQDNIFFLVSSSPGGYDCMARQSNGRYVMAGVGSSGNNINNTISVYEPFLYFFDGNDSIRKLVPFIDSNVSRYISSMAVDSNNNIIAVGQISSKSYHLDSWDSLYFYDSLAIGLFKYDSSGQLLWQKPYKMSVVVAGNNIYVSPNKIVISADGQSYLMTGAIESDTTGGMRTFLMKTDTAGNVLWYKYLPYNMAMGNFKLYNADIIAAKGGGYYFVGTNEVFVDTIDQTYLYYGKFDEDGNILWSKNYCEHKPPYAYYIGGNIRYSTDGNLLLSGQYEDQIYNPILLKTDTLGNEIWYREQAYINTFSPVQYLYNLNAVPDGRILLTGTFATVGTASYFDTVGNLSWIVLTDSLGERYPGDTLLENFLAVPTVAGTNSSIKFYPNPVNEQLYVNTFDQTGITLELTDISGRQLLSMPLQAGVTPVNMEQYTAGLYIAKVYNNTGQLVKVQKVVKE